jgi:hypothetical protein
MQRVLPAGRHVAHAVASSTRTPSDGSASFRRRLPTSIPQAVNRRRSAASNPGVPLWKSAGVVLARGDARWVGQQSGADRILAAAIMLRMKCPLSLD